MKNLLPTLLLGGACALGACDRSPKADTKLRGPVEIAQPAPATAAEPALKVSTHEEARAAVAAYLKAQPNAALYVVDSANVVNVDTHFQVLVPRTDWKGRMPNRERFEVDKATGIVQGLPVK
jgi:hypothetical protein